MKRIGFLFFLLGALLIVAFFETATARNRALPFSTVRLSDSTQTEGDILPQSEPEAAITAGEVHTLWGEERNSGEYAFYYRDLPGGATEQLATESVSELYDGMIASAASASRACFHWFAWEQQVFCSDYSAPITVTGRLHDLALDNDDDAHGVTTINQGSPPWHEELYYWSEAAGTITLLSDLTGPTTPIVEPHITFAAGRVHAVWSEETAENVFAPFYWDSASNQVRPLGDADTLSVDNFRLLSDDNGTMHVFWEAETHASGPHACPMHWDSTSQITTNLNGSPTGCASRGFVVKADDSGRLHAVWENGDIFYWNSDDAVVVNATNDSGMPRFRMTPRLFVENGEAYVAYAEDPTSSFQWDLRVWNASTQLDVHVGSEPAQFGLNGAVAPDGTLHILWSQEENSDTWHHFYWESGTSQNVLLSQDPALDGGMLFQGLMATGSGRTDILWVQDLSDGSAGALVTWDSVTESTTTVAELTLYGSVPAARLQPDAFGNLQATWLSDGSGSTDADIYFWRNTSDEPVNLSDLTGADGGDVLDFFGSRTFNLSNGATYVVWTEETGTAEGSDLFAAWFMQSLPEKVFLPVVLR